MNKHETNLSHNRSLRAAHFFCWVLFHLFYSLHTSLKHCETETESTLDLKGENFHSNLRVWLGDCECDTMYKSSTQLKCIVAMSELAKSKYVRQSAPSKVPILLVRNFDGVVYNTNLLFNFSSSNSKMAPFITNSRASLSKSMAKWSPGFD